jgi:YesN/AraC family two-component response regulator
MTQFVSFKNPVLRQCIHHISFNQFEKQSDAFVPVLPDGMTELVINLGSLYERYSGNAKQVSRINKSHIIGIKSKHAMVKPSDDMNLINIRFKPACLQYFINEDASLLVDKVLDAEHFFGNSIFELEHQLYDKKDPVQSIMLIENYLMSKFKSNEKTDLACQLLTEIYTNPTTNNLNHIVYQSSDYKSIERLFKSEIGLNPKYYTRLVQFNYAVSKLNKEKELPLTEIAYQSGYFDQSHFNRTFKKFSGMSPKAYLANREPMLLNNDNIIQSMFIGKNNGFKDKNHSLV